jgi:hypothetical protein
MAFETAIWLQQQIRAPGDSDGHNGRTAGADAVHAGVVGFALIFAVRARFASATILRDFNTCDNARP